MTRGLSPEQAELEEMHEAVSHLRCPRCDVEPGQRCVNPVAGREARVPCLARARAADDSPSASPYDSSPEFRSFGLRD